MKLGEVAERYVGMGRVGRGVGVDVIVGRLFPAFPNTAPKRRERSESSSLFFRVFGHSPGNRRKICEPFH